MQKMNQITRNGPISTQIEVNTTVVEQEIDTRGELLARLQENFALSE